MSLCVRIKKRTGKGDVVLGVCCRPSDQEEQVGEALYRQIGTASRSQALVFMWDFKHAAFCCRDSMAGHKQSRSALVITLGI